MRYLAVALTLAACSPLVRTAAEEAPEDAGTPTASVLDINGALVTPGVFMQICNVCPGGNGCCNAVATSSKFYLRAAEGNAPDCWYGVFVADPAAAPNSAGVGPPNNGMLLSALGDMAAINSDQSLGGANRTTCPYPQSYPVGGNIPDGIKIGDQVAISGYSEPFCDYYNTSLGQCAADLFPEFTPDSPGAGQANGVVTDLGATTPILPVLVQPSQISDQALNAIQYAGELVEVQNVTVASADQFGDTILNQAALWVTPELSNVTVAATTGFAYCSITGNLHYQGDEDSHWELRPRSQADVVAAPCP
jgi:hypothetical protein